MTKLPETYAWLAKEPGPKMILEALKLYGTLEAPGGKDNPEIIAWAKEIGLATSYTHDSIPWCGLFIGVVAKRAGKPLVATPLWAKDWANFGRAAKPAMLGDVLVFSRDGGGHVGLYVAEDYAAYHVLGGNQGDKVSIVRIAKSRLFAARRPIYNVTPENVRRVRVQDSGELSKNEV